MRPRDLPDDPWPGYAREEFKDVEWDEDDQFVPAIRRRYRWDLIADQLRQRPGKWAHVKDSAGRPLPQSDLDNRASGCPIPMRVGRWQSAHRRGELWLRYLGE